VVIGALPGLSGSTGIILLLPLVYRLPASTALIMLCGLFCGSMYGGSISAILLNTPGTPSATATVLDGYPLCQKGEAGKALGVSAISSFLGGLISAICLILIAPQLAKIALSFKAADYFSLSLFGLSIMASTDKDVVKGLISGTIGLLISTIGVDALMGIDRFTFGNYKLMRGIPLLPVLIGVFAISEVFITAQKDIKNNPPAVQKIGRILPTKEEFKKFSPSALVGSIIGVLIGIIPGTGGSISCFLAYQVSQKMSNTPEEFGHGAMEGIAAAESSNNGTTGGALIPMLCLGVPGDVVTSVMLGALILIGVRPGPLLFTESPDIVYAIFAGMLVIQFIMLIAGLGCAKVSPYILKISQSLLMPIIAILCLVGAFSNANNVFDLLIALIFGIVGFGMKKFGYPGAPLVLGLILGPIAEENLNRALILSNNNWMTFITSPISAVFLLLALVSIAYSVIGNMKKPKTK
ncbi:MAG: tripartite tricarboxylate transporter permease, partial [Sphaerochaetaceae bacterium]|nr:tripartite tricarboxylate transporter permease [Sphaerochaetaceae bacterium]